MDYDINYIETSYSPQELEKEFIKDFTAVRLENNLTQSLLAKYSHVNREKIARIENNMYSPSLINLLKVLGPIGYTIKIVKKKNL